VGAPLLVVTPWYPERAPGSLLDAAVAAAVDAAVRAGADVTVVHLVPRHAPDDAGRTEAADGPSPGGVPVRQVAMEAASGASPGGVPVRRVVAEAASGVRPGEVPVRRVMVDGGVPPGDPAAVDAVAAALADGAADLLGAAAVVHAHAGVPVAAAVARVAPEGARLVVGEHLPSALPLLAAPLDDALTAAWQSVLARADVVLAPSEDLARRLARCGGGSGESSSNCSTACLPAGCGSPGPP